MIDSEMFNAGLAFVIGAIVGTIIVKGCQKLYQLLFLRQKQENDITYIGRYIIEKDLTIGDKTYSGLRWDCNRHDWTEASKDFIRQRVTAMKTSKEQNTTVSRYNMLDNTTFEEIASLNGLIIISGKAGSGKSLLLHEIVRHDLKQGKKCYLIQEKWHKKYKEYDDLKDSGLVIYDIDELGKEELVELLKCGNVYFDNVDDFEIMDTKNNLDPKFQFEFNDINLSKNKVVFSGQRLLKNMSFAHEMERELRKAYGNTHTISCKLPENETSKEFQLYIVDDRKKFAFKKMLKIRKKSRS